MGFYFGVSETLEGKEDKKSLSVGISMVVPATDGRLFIEP